MTVTKWASEYGRLTDFIVAHPQISIDPSGIAIPADVRDEFYRLFDDARRALVEEHYVEADVLSSNYVQVEQEITRRLGLESITIPIDLYSFLHNPQDGLVRALFFQLFDLLQGKMTQDAFEQEVAAGLAPKAAGLVRLGYEMWTALALINLFEPSKAYVPMIDEPPGGQSELKLYVPQTITLGSQPADPPVRLPELIVNSSKTSQHIAVKLELSTDVPRYPGVYGHGPDQNRALRYSGDTSAIMGGRTLLFYLMDNLDEIPVIANIAKHTISEPDLVIEWTRPGELQDPFVLDPIKERYDILKPRLGTYLVSREPLGPEHLEIAGYDFHLLTVGFYLSKLQSIVDVLLGS